MKAMLLHSAMAVMVMVLTAMVLSKPLSITTTPWISGGWEA